MHALGWGLPAEGFTWAGVEFGGDGVEVLTGVGREIGSLGEILPEQAVGVFVGASLPGTGGVTEVDRHVGCRGELVVASHLNTLVPGQGPFELRGQVKDGVEERIADQVRCTSVGKVDEHEVAGAAFD